MKKWHGIWLTWLLLATMSCVGGKGTGVLQVTSPEMAPPPQGPGGLRTLSDYEG